jgi:hypothetical protein
MSDSEIIQFIDAAEHRSFERAEKSLDTVFHALKEEIKRTQEQVRRLEETVARLRGKEGGCPPV